MAALLCLAMLCSCGGPTEPLPQRDEGSDALGEVRVQEPIEFTGTAYTSELKGEMDISTLRGLVDTDERVWHGFAPGDSYPVEGDCEPDRRNNQEPQDVAQLPAVIEGIVTLHPRYFIKPAICGSDQRYYGSFMIQDATGGILIMRDSRISPFSFGDRVRLRVKGIMRYFDYSAVIAFDDIEVVETAEKTPIYYKPVNGALDPADAGEVVRLVGRITSESTNNNFNELQMESLDGEHVYLASLDRELGQRRPDLKVGYTIELTGPVINSFGLRLLISSYGQIRYCDESGQNCTVERDN